jgi:hypothetical protein
MMKYEGSVAGRATEKFHDNEILNSFAIRFRPRELW